MCTNISKMVDQCRPVNHRMHCLLLTMTSSGSSKHHLKPGELHEKLLIVIRNMHQNGIQLHDPDSSYFTMLSGLILCLKFHICLPISAHGLRERFMFVTLFVWLTYINHWIVKLYQYGFLVNEVIGLIVAIQTFYPNSLSVLYSKYIYPSSIVWSTTFPFIVLKSHYAIWNTIISFPNFMLFYVTYTMAYIYLCTFVCVYIQLLPVHHTLDWEHREIELVLSSLLCSLHIVLLSIIPSSFYANHTT